MAIGISQAYKISERHACRILDLNRSSKRYKATDKSEDEKIIDRMKELIRKQPDLGYRRLHAILKDEGLVQNQKRTHRLYCISGLNVLKKQG